jgi:DNA gyrase subunit A
MGRPTQGVRVMNMKEDDRVSAVALVVEDDAGDTEEVEGTPPLDAAPVDEAPAEDAPEEAPAEDADADDA